MPTGYTADIMKGKLTFEEYVWKCARAFAFVAQRDESLDAPVSLVREANTDHYNQSIQRAQERLKALEAMTPQEVEAAYEDYYENLARSVEESNSRREREEANYKDMLSQVKAWELPNEDYRELKQFMISQIEESLEYDISYRDTPERQDPMEWHQMNLEAAQDTVDWNVKARTRETLKARKETQWLQDFHDSVPCPNLRK